MRAAGTQTALMKARERKKGKEGEEEGKEGRRVLLTGCRIPSMMS